MVAGDARLGKKSAQNLQAAFDGARVAAFASEQAEENFGMQVLADFVDDADVFEQRFRFVAGERVG